MSSPPIVPIAAECPHGLRPGTTICLRCRQEARAVARQRRMRLAARAGLALITAALAITLIVGAWSAIVPERRGTETLLNESSGTPAVGEAARPAPSRSAPGLVPSMAEGRRDLGDSVFAVRDGAQVTVFFDTDSLRTRFDWKFEGVVRATLPLVFPEVVAPLDSIPAGTLASGGNLLRDLRTRGIPIRVGDHTLRVWPVTRDGRDGPLIIGYRAAATKR